MHGDAPVNESDGGFVHTPFLDSWKVLKGVYKSTFKKKSIVQRLSL